MENEILTDKLYSIAERMNLRVYADELNLPVINGYNILQNKVPEIIFIAKSNQGFIEQIISDGILNENETFDSRINKSIDDIKLFMKQNNFFNPNVNITYYKDFKNDSFNYKVFVQNNILESDSNRIVTRQFIAFFLEPKNNIFYQISLCSSPELLSSTKINLNAIDIVSDPTTKYLENIMNVILTNITYK